LSFQIIKASTHKDNGSGADATAK